MSALHSAFAARLVVVLAVFSLAGGYVPEWSDWNESDPGITLLEAP